MAGLDLINSLIQAPSLGPAQSAQDSLRAQTLDQKGLLEEETMNEFIKSLQAITKQGQETPMASNNILAVDDVQEQQVAPATLIDILQQEMAKAATQDVAQPAPQASTPVSSSSVEKPKEGNLLLDILQSLQTNQETGESGILQDIIRTFAAVDAPIASKMIESDITTTKKGIKAKADLERKQAEFEQKKADKIEEEKRKFMRDIELAKIKSAVSGSSDFSPSHMLSLLRMTNEETADIGKAVDKAFQIAKQINPNTKWNKEDIAEAQVQDATGGAKPGKLTIVGKNSANKTVTLSDGSVITFNEAVSRGLV